MKAYNLKVVIDFVHSELSWNWHALIIQGNGTSNWRSELRLPVAKQLNNLERVNWMFYFSMFMVDK